MKNRFLLALLGATTLIPATAMAQEVAQERGPRGGRERIERMGGGEAPQARAEFNTGVRVQAPEPRAERPQGDAGPRWQGRPDRGDGGNAWQGRPDRGERPDRGDGDRGQGRPDRGDRPGAGAGWQPRPDRPDRPQGVEQRGFPRDAQGQVDREALRRQWQDGRRGEWQRGQVQRDQWQRDQQRNDWQRDQQRGDWQRDRDRRDWGRQDGGWNRSDGDWRDNGRYRNDWNDRRDWNGQWNRGWRTDRRYDWNRYRDANRGIYRLPRYYAPQGWGYGYRRFGIGVTLNSFLFGSNYWINDPYYYRLPEAYGPYRWVRYYNDALLVDVRTGRVVDVEYDIFW